MQKDYLQLALHTFNGGNWYGWKKEDADGNKIPNSERMQYKYVKIIKDDAIMPSETDVNAKIQELKDEGKIKMITPAEVKGIVGTDKVEGVSVVQNGGDEFTIETDHFIPLFGLML